MSGKKDVMDSLFGTESDEESEEDRGKEEGQRLTPSADDAGRSPADSPAARTPLDTGRDAGGGDPGGASDARDSDGEMEHRDDRGEGDSGKRTGYREGEDDERAREGEWSGRGGGSEDGSEHGGSRGFSQGGDEDPPSHFSTQGATQPGPAEYDSDFDSREAERGGFTERRLTGGPRNSDGGKTGNAVESRSLAGMNDVAAAQKAVFGDSSDEDDDVDQAGGAAAAPRVEAAQKAVFGDSSDEEGHGQQAPQEKASVFPDEEGEDRGRRKEVLEEVDEYENLEDDIGEEERGGEGKRPGLPREQEERLDGGMEDEYREERPVAPPLDLELPLMPPPAPMDKMKLMVASHALGLATKEFDPEAYDEEDAGLVENVVRWRTVLQPDGSHKIESNARIVKWSDGSMHLFLGSEPLAIDCLPMERENAHLFLHHTATREKGSALQCQGRLKEKLRVRPVDTGSKIHKKLTLGLTSKYRKQVRIKDIVSVGDPEKEYQEKEKLMKKDQKEWERKQQRQRHMELMQRAKATQSTQQNSWPQGGRERWPAGRGGYGGYAEEGEDYLEEDEEFEEERPRERKEAKKAQSRRGYEEEDEEEEEEEEEDEEAEEDEEEEEEAVDTEEEAEEEEEEPKRRLKEGKGKGKEGGDKDEEFDEAEDAGEGPGDPEEGRSKRPLGESQSSDEQRAKVQRTETGARHEDAEWGSERGAVDSSQALEESRKPAGGKRRVLVDSDED